MRLLASRLNGEFGEPLADRLVCQTFAAPLTGKG